MQRDALKGRREELASGPTGLVAMTAQQMFDRGSEQQLTTHAGTHGIEFTAAKRPFTAARLHRDRGPLGMPLLKFSYLLASKLAGSRRRPPIHTERIEA